jgi:2'-5' RNA ligase
MAGGLNREEEVYQKLWKEAEAAFDRGAPRLDPFLKNRAGDKRRGITLIARPDSRVCLKVKKVLDEIATAAPSQHFYQSSEFHLTVLSVIPGSERWQICARRLPEYLALLDTVLDKRPAFSLAFRGVTASPDAIMVQGFPIGGALSKLRGDLRDALSQNRLANNLDRRYKLVAAHLTVVRFSNPQPDWQALKMLLKAHRRTDFGKTRVRSLQLVEGDWYASSDSVRILREYPLC